MQRLWSKRLGPSPTAGAFWSGASSVFAVCVVLSAVGCRPRGWSFGPREPVHRGVSRVPVAENLPSFPVGVATLGRLRADIEVVASTGSRPAAGRVGEDRARVEWIVAALGKPARKTPYDGESAVWRWEYTMRRTPHGEVFLHPTPRVSSHSVQAIVYMEVRRGRAVRIWSDGVSF